MPLPRRLRDWFCRRPVMGFAGGIPAPAIERVVKRDAGLELLEIVVIDPRQAQRRRQQPGRFGRQTSRAVSAARTIVASRSNGGVARPNSSTITSNVQSSPRWLQNTFSISKGTALKRSPTATTSAGATNRNTAFGSTNLLISQGQAIRSIFGRARVTQTVRPLASRGGSFDTGTSGRF